MQILFLLFNYPKNRNFFLHNLKLSCITVFSPHLQNLCNSFLSVNKSWQSTSSEWCCWHLRLAWNPCSWILTFSKGGGWIIKCGHPEMTALNLKTWLYAENHHIMINISPVSLCQLKRPQLKLLLYFNLIFPSIISFLHHFFKLCGAVSLVILKS